MESNNELIDVLQKQMAAIEFSKQREVQLRQDEAELLVKPSLHCESVRSLNATDVLGN